VAKLREFPCEAARRVFLALVLHDAVYVAGDADNEARSAELARDLLARHSSIGEAEIGDVASFILATKSHAPPAGAGYDLRATLDIDMSILAAPTPRYATYAAEVRREWVPTAVTDAQFNAGRAAFLQSLLRAAAIFHTPEGWGRWESDARANIERELGALSRGVI